MSVYQEGLILECDIRVCYKKANHERVCYGIRGHNPYLAKRA